MTGSAQKILIRIDPRTTVFLEDHKTLTLSHNVADARVPANFRRCVNRCKNSTNSRITSRSTKLIRKLNKNLRSIKFRSILEEKRDEYLWNKWFSIIK